METNNLNALPQIKTKPIFPFGTIIQANENGLLTDLSIKDLTEIIHQEKVVLLKGFKPMESNNMLNYAKQWGDLLEWNFGHILNLEIKENANNYLFTKGNVPFHWDGAFANSVPSFLFFQCLRANINTPGGESTFCDTQKVLEKASPQELKLWKSITITYSTDKNAHYGGKVVQKLVHYDEHLGKDVIRFAEPLNEESVQLNPIHIEILGFSSNEQNDFLKSFIPKLYESDVCYQHRWETGDYLLIDNLSLLHGRNPLKDNIDRYLQRIHIL
ncbi:TauD/TfdA family dioxygenase [Aquimarina macrocephali]|uniref:TauD/TfdA family dioxygenase n=1 Tax=Aquimarina macrocephali TaxID=666563 RepID=UPI000463812F|nr:TauD/TfdA family dioxygenase [Aquimarina macrocephali]